MNKKSKNLFLGFLFTLLIFVSITAISATDTNSTSTQVEKQDVATQTVGPVEKTTSTQVTKTQETDNKIKTTTKENKKETTTKTTTQKQDTTANNVQKDTTKTIKNTDTTTTKNTTANTKTIKTITKTLKQETFGTFTELQTAINNVREGSTVNLNNSYMSYGKYLTIDKSITINGNGHILDAKGNKGIFNIMSGNVILNNMTIMDSTGSAITILSGANVTENNINATNNTATNGGVNLNAGNLTINNGTYKDNTATDSGGVNYNYGTLTINNGTFTNNAATNVGGVSYNSHGNLTIKDGTFTNNTATEGGVSYNYQSNITINSGTFTNNNATLGGVNYNSHGNLTVTGGNYTNSKGYVFYSNGDYFEVVNSSFINNTCDGKLFNVKPDVISGNTYIGNNLTATMNINPTTITTKGLTTITITITPDDMYNTTIDIGNITIYEDENPVATNQVNNNLTEIDYKPHGGKYTLKIAYNDSTNSYKTTTTQTIDVNTPISFIDLQILIDDTKAGETLTLNRNYTKLIDDALTISKDITIEGHGFTLDANGTAGIFNIMSGNVILNNMTIKNSTSSAITISKGANVTENNINANNNNATRGGVNYNQGNLTINNGTYKNNKATQYGGVNYNQGNLTINNGTYTNNTSRSDNARGGVNYNTGTLNITHGIFSINYANRGGVNFNTGTLSITNGTFSNNGAIGNDDSFGGGVNYNTGTLTIENGTYKDNVATSGGVNFNTGTLSITNGTYTNNTVAYGGVNFNSESATLNIANGIFSNNHAIRGGVNYNRGTLTIENGTFTGNNATLGGVNYNYQGSKLNITNGNYTDNTATNQGGVNINQGTLTINNGTYQDNKGDYLICNDNIFNIANVTFINNNCSSGDLFNKQPNTISGNTYIGNNLTATITINPETITTRDPTKITITITPDDMYNTTINSGNLTIYEDNEIVQTSQVKDNTSSIIYTPHAGKYTLKIAYTDLTNSYINNTIKEIRVTLSPEAIINLDNITIKYNDTNTMIRINVTDEDDNKVTGGKVILKLNGKTLRDSEGNILSTTVENGEATITTTFSQKIGIYKITTIYSGNTQYGLATNQNTTLTITPREAQINFQKEPTPATIGEETILTLKITDNNTPINTGRVIVKLNGRSVRDSNGNIVYANVENGEAKITFTIPDTFKAKTYTLTAVYGDNSYNRTENTTQIIITNPINILQTTDTSIITTAHTIPSNDSQTNITLIKDSTPKTVKI